MFKLLRDIVIFLVAIVLIVRALSATNFFEWFTNNQNGVQVAENTTGTTNRIKQSCTSPRGSQLQDGEFVFGFEEYTVNDVADCKREVRQCNNGILEGSFTFRVCQGPNGFLGDGSGIPRLEDVSLARQGGNGGSCMTPWGNIVQDGDYTIAYGTPYGTYGCSSEKRYCNNGVLGGSFSYSTCDMQNRYLAGRPSGTAYRYVAPKKTQTTISSYRPRTTTVSSNTNSCETPRGSRVNNGMYTTAYRNTTSVGSQGCVSEKRYCKNGVLDGSFQYTACRTSDIIEGVSARKASNDMSIKDSTITDSIVNSNNVINSNNSTVQNYNYQNSFNTDSNNNNSNSNNPNNNQQGSASAGGSTQTPTQGGNGSSDGLSCYSPRGSTIKNGYTVQAYNKQSGNCSKRERACINGKLDSVNGLADYIYQSCSTQSTSSNEGNTTSNISPSNPASALTCTSPRGSTVKNGYTIQAYNKQSGNCSKRERACINGKLDSVNGLADYIYQTCN